MITDRHRVTWRHIRLTGGVLHGCRVRVTRLDADRGVVRVPGHRGRYVEADGEWFWEADRVS